MLLACVAIGIIAAIVTGWFLYQSRMELWKTQARSAFRVALEEELQKSSMDVYLTSSGNFRLPDDSIDTKKEPVKVRLENEYGKKEFLVPYEKHVHNMDYFSGWRMMRSVTLEERPLKADSLDLAWKKLLEEKGYSGKTVVRMSVADWQGQEVYTCSADSLYLSESDSVVTYYLGYRCEVGVTGYLYGSWWTALSWKDKVLLCVLIVCCILPSFVHGHVRRICCRLFVKKVPAVTGKAGSVIAVNRNEAHVYRMEDDLRFDADSSMLCRAGVCVKLAPLSAKLLKGFLDARDCRLSNDEILHLLWPNGTGTLDNLHTNIRRLRGYLSHFPSCVIENENSGYRLKNLHSIG